MKKTLSLMMLTVSTLAAQTLSFFPQVAQAPEYARAIAADSTGLYVAGEVRQTYYTTDDAHAFLRKFDAQGAVIWARTFDIATAATAVAVAASGIYVGGYTAASATPTVHDAFLRRYDSDGNQGWTRRFTVQANTRLNSLIADDAGVYAVAWSSPQDDSFPGYSASWTLRRFDADGQELWSLPVSGKPGILRADATGLYFIAGASLQKYSRSGTRTVAKVLSSATGAMLAANSEGFYTTTVSYSEAGQIAGRKFQSYDYDGNLRWTRDFPGELGEYNSSAIAADEDGFYFAASMYGTLEGQCRSGNLDLQVSRFDSEGNRIWQRQFGTNTLPHAMVRLGLIMFPERIEDIYPDAPKSLDPVLGAEAVTVHEAGHIFADALRIDGNTFVGEFVANVFMAGYIRAARPDLTFMLNGPFPGMKTPRHTSGGDLNYLEGTLPPENYLWFELQLQRLADFCVKSRDFGEVARKLAIAFPAVRPRHVNNVEASTRLEGLFPGFKTAAGPIAEPPTITRIRLSTCKDSSSGPAGEGRLMVIRNDTASRLDLTRLDGSKLQVDAYAWRRYGLPAGTQLRMSDGRCLATGAAGDPVLAIIEE